MKVLMLALSFLVAVLTLPPSDSRAKDETDPVRRAESIISQTKLNWTPVGYAATVGVIDVGGTVALNGGAYVLLESPSLAVDMAKGGFIGVGEKVTKDAIMNIIESSVRTPRALCKTIAKAAMDQGLSDYKAAYKIAHRYLETGSLTRSDAINFLKHRWGLYRLTTAKQLANGLYAPEASVTTSTANAVTDELTKRFITGYQNTIGADNTVPIADAALFLRDLSRILEQKKLGLMNYQPYVTFSRQITEIDRQYLAEQKSFISSSVHVTSGTQVGPLTWIETSDGLTNKHINCLLISSSGYLFAATDAGVYTSKDNGTSWSEVGLQKDRVYSLANASEGVMVAGTWDGVYTSRDGGANWTLAGLWSSGGYTESIVVSIASNQHGYLFAGTMGGLNLSTDYGASWRKLNFPNTGSASVYSLAMKSSRCIFAGTYPGVCVSTDNGFNWSVKNNGLPNVSVFSICLGPSGHVFAGTLKGVYVSTDGGDVWQLSGLSNDAVISLYADQTKGTFAGTSNSGIYYLSHNGSVWSSANEGLTNKNVKSIIITASRYIFVGTDDGIFRAKLSK